MRRLERLSHGWLLVLVLAACSDSGSDTDDAATAGAGANGANAGASVANAGASGANAGAGGGSAGANGADAGAQAGSESKVVLDFSASPLSVSAGNNTIFVPIYPPGTHLRATATDTLGARAVYTRSGCSEFALQQAPDQLPAANQMLAIASVEVTADLHDSSADVSGCIAYRTMEGWRAGADPSTHLEQGSAFARLHFQLDAPAVDMLAIGGITFGATAVHEIALELR